MSTIDYYDQNAQEYYERTVDADLAEIREYFLGFLRMPGSWISGAAAGVMQRLLLRREGQSRHWTARRSFAGSHRNIWEWMSVI